MSLLMDIMMKMGGHPSELEIIEFALDGIEGTEQREKIARHLKSCRPCRNAVAAAMELHDGLAASVPQVEPPAGLADRLLERVLRAPRNMSQREEGKP